MHHIGANSAVSEDNAQQVSMEQPFQGARQQEEHLQSANKGQWPVSGDTIHTLCTSNGSPYLNYQTRIM